MHKNTGISKKYFLADVLTREGEIAFFFHDVHFFMYSSLRRHELMCKFSGVNRALHVIIVPI
jgi:hypothetical protein